MDDRTELLALFKEAAAVSGWMLIRLAETNEAYFNERPDYAQQLNEALNNGMTHSEAGNERLAYMSFLGCLKSIDRHSARILTSDPEIVEGRRRLGHIDERMKPLWAKYQHTF